MICINVNIPDEICKIDDELKAIYHSSDSICIWVFKSRSDRNKFMDETAGMLKKDREDYYISNFKQYSMRYFLSWLAIAFGIIYFIFETWYHTSYVQSNLALTADYISILLLLIAGIVNLRTNKGIGLLCGAWGIHLV